MARGLSGGQAATDRGEAGSETSLSIAAAARHSPCDPEGIAQRFDNRTMRPACMDPHGPRERSPSDSPALQGRVFRKRKLSSRVAAAEASRGATMRDSNPQGGIAATQPG